MMYHNSIVQGDLREITACDFVPWDKLRGRTILVNGATGMIASYVIYTLLYLNAHRAFGVRVIAHARSRTKMESLYGEFIESGELEVIYGDVRESVEVSGDVHYVLHLAGGASPSAIKSDPVGIIEANSLGLINSLELAKAKGAHLLYASTREVYGQMPQGVMQIKEEDMGVLPVLDARSCYPMSKRLGETLCKSYEVQYDVFYTVLRIAHSYGPTMSVQGDGRIMADVLGDGIGGRNIVLFSAGDALRSFIYVTDTVSGLFCALLAGGRGEPYNLANEGEEISVLELAQMVTRKCGVGVVCKEASQQQKGAYVAFGRVALCTTKLEALGWHCTVGVEEGVERTINSKKLCEN